MYIAEPLTLPCGAVLSNRLAKSSMSEGLADRTHRPNPRINRLYGTWARGGAGLLLSGNVMVDRNALAEAGSIVAEDSSAVPGLRSWADTVHEVPGVALWMQINHPGHQALLPLRRRPVSASEAGMQLPLMSRRRSHVLSTAEVKDLVQRFVRTSELAIETGWDGVQIHAAHGYLLSQFLSPKINTRTDEFGGSARGRRKFLLDIINAVRTSLGPSVPVSVKLNAADFAYGGFTEKESLDVAVALADAGVDLLEISGGGYSSPANFVGPKPLDRTPRPYEPFFLPYAQQLRERTSMPIMLTGGQRTRDAMEATLADGTVDVIGLARPLAVYPDYPARLLAGETEPAISENFRLPFRPLDAGMQLMMHANQFHRIASGLRPIHQPGALSALQAAGRMGVETVAAEFLRS